MTMTITILLFLIAHIIADFYLQSTRLANDKQEYIGALVQHIIIYSVVMLIFGALFWDLTYLLLALSLAAVHALIDYCKFLYSRNRQLTKANHIQLFMFDQALHVLTIIGLITIFYHSFTLESAWFNDVVSFINTTYLFSAKVALQWILAVLLSIKPASIVVKMSLGYFEPKELQKDNPGIIQAGEFIGILERLIILVLLATGSYAAIGFVLTAKSIARYNKIAEEPKFAEYYLIGTLVSTLFVLIIYQLIFY